MLCMPLLNPSEQHKNQKVIVQLFTFNTSVHVKVQIFFLHRE